MKNFRDKTEIEILTIRVFLLNRQDDSIQTKFLESLLKSKKSKLYNNCSKLKKIKKQSLIK